MRFCTNVGLVLKNLIGGIIFQMFGELKWLPKIKFRETIHVYLLGLVLGDIDAILWVVGWTQFAWASKPRSTLLVHVPYVCQTLTTPRGGFSTFLSSREILCDHTISEEILNKIYGSFALYRPVSVHSLRS